MTIPLVWRAATVAAITLIMAASATNPAHAQRMVASSDRSEARSTNVLARPISLSLRQVTLAGAIKTIAASANVQIYYRRELLDTASTSITLDVDNLPLGMVLERVFRGTHLHAVPASENVLTVQVTAGADSAAQGIVVGTVVSATTKRPVAGATVLVDEAQKGVRTGEDGTFRLPVLPGEHVLRVRSVGFAKQERRVVVASGQTVTADLVLEPSTSVLNEVIVTGTVIATERKAIPTPITVITAKDIEKRGITKVEQLFRGEVPGLIALERGSAVYAQESFTNNYVGQTNFGGNMNSALYSRGASSLDGQPNPLKTYVDGIELADPSYLGTIDPQSIERIEIITGPQAATIYGSGALGGVMQIFTKRGTGNTTPDVTLNLSYGFLQNDASGGLTPAHAHTFNVSGGTGPAFSYAANGSYTYTGQWQPGLYSRLSGASIGATHTRTRITMSGSVSLMTGANGLVSLTNSSGTPYIKQKVRDGEWDPRSVATGSLGQESTSSSQTLSLNVDLRATPTWSHHASVGRNQNHFEFEPFAPAFASPRDSNFMFAQSVSSQITASYNSTWTAGHGPVSSALTLGANGSDGDNTSWSAAAAQRKATSLVTTTISQGAARASYGGFGSWQIGLFDRLYLTLGLRGEHSASYGNERPIDWTPTNGIAYTHEIGELTIKLLGSYGRATKAPPPAARLSTLSTFSPYYDPAQYINQFGNDALRPEYERGPQGGIEMYFANLGSLTINAYHQMVTDLLQRVAVDSVERSYIPSPFVYKEAQYQWQNVAKIEKRGIEMTGSMNLAMLSLKGTYSWNQSRVRELAANYYGSQYRVGQSALMVPTHTANLVASYALGGTSVTLVTNYIGTRPSDNNAAPVVWESVFNRLMQYAPRKTNDFYLAGYTSPAYVKSDLAISRRVSPTVSLTLNVTNLGNSYESDAWAITPSLGRQTRMGVAIRALGAR